MPRSELGVDLEVAVEPPPNSFSAALCATLDDRIHPLLFVSSSVLGLLNQR